MTIDKDKLKSLAEAAPYKDWSRSSYEALGGRAHIVMHGSFDHLITTFEESSAEFIAAASPGTVLALLAEIERTDGRLHDVAKLCATVEQERDQLKTENEALRKALLEASEEVATWGEYASEYFQKKHDLAGCVAKIHAAAMGKEASHE